jgi:hypothetical protein
VAAVAAAKHVLVQLILIVAHLLQPLVHGTTTNRAHAEASLPAFLGFQRRASGSRRSHLEQVHGIHLLFQVVPIVLHRPPRGHTTVDSVASRCWCGNSVAYRGVTNSD